MDNSVIILPLTCFKKHLNSFICPKGKSFYGINDNSGIKLSKIRVQFPDLRDHRYTHNFNCKSPICLCGLKDETTVHYFLCCPHYQSQRNILLSDISEIICSDVTVLLDDHLNQILMYGSNVYIPNCNKLIIEQFILFMKSSRRFKQLRGFFLTFMEP